MSDEDPVQQPGRDEKATGPGAGEEKGEEEDAVPADPDRTQSEAEAQPRPPDLSDEPKVALEIDTAPTAVPPATAVFHQSLRHILPFDQLLAHVFRHTITGLPVHEIRTHSEDQIAAMLLGADYDAVGSHMSAGVLVHEGCENQYNVAYLTTSSWLYHRMSRYAVRRYGVLRTASVIAVPIIYVGFCIIIQLIELYLRTYLKLTQALRGGEPDFEDKMLCDYIEKSTAQFVRALRSGTDRASGARQANSRNRPLILDQNWALDRARCSRAFIRFSAARADKTHPTAIRDVFAFLGLFKLKRVLEGPDDATRNPFGDVLLERPVDTYNMVGCWLDDCLCNRCSTLEQTDMTTPVNRGKLDRLTGRVLQGAGHDLDFFMMINRARVACAYEAHKFRTLYMDARVPDAPALVPCESPLERMMEGKRAHLEAAAAASSSSRSAPREPVSEEEKEKADEKLPLISPPPSGEKSGEKGDQEPGGLPGQEEEEEEEQKEGGGCSVQ